MHDQQATLTKTLQTIETIFGNGTIFRLSDGPVAAGPALSTGILSLDLGLGVGGLPLGRIVEIFGPEASGKTSLALATIAQTQKTGGVAAFVDAEHSLDATYAKHLGVDLEALLLSQPDHGEQALEIVCLLAGSGAVDLIVVDSVAALTPKAEIEGAMGDSHMGLTARLMSQAMRKLSGVLARAQCTVVFINQLRMKIGVMFGNPETTTGGMALKFYASVRLDVRRIASLKQGDQVTGSRIRVKVVKNKVAAPFKEAEFDMVFGKGPSASGDVLDLAVARGLVEKAGSWFTVGERKLGQGREAAKEALDADPALATQLATAVRAQPGASKAGVADTAAEPGGGRPPKRKQA